MTQPYLSKAAATAQHEGGLRLEYPQTVARFDTYLDAQKAVDTLADKGFPVENVAIVGSDLRQYERVLGRRTLWSEILKGVASGIGTGLLVAMMFWLLVESNFVNALLYGIGIGVGIGILFGIIGWLATKGPRDFDSITQTYALSYEILAEHKVAQQAREILGTDVVPGVPGVPGPGVAPATL